MNHTNTQEGRGDETALATSAPIIGPDKRSRFLSEADCHDVMQRLAHFAKGGGVTNVQITSTWLGNVRWARNQVSTSGDVIDNAITVQRNVNGATGQVKINDTTDVALVAAARRAERLAVMEEELTNSELLTRLPLEPSTKPSLFSEETYQLDATKRAAAALELTKIAREAGMLSAGYIEVAAVGMAILDTFGRFRYFPYTQARYSVTVRDPKGTGSGWAGVDWYDWHKLDPSALTARALEKCLRSRNPVAIEPGRYTTILEPQAVSDFAGLLVRLDGHGALDRAWSEPGAYPNNPKGPFLLKDPVKKLGIITEPGYAELGLKVVDERITISTDPMDPEMGFPPFGYTKSVVGDGFVMPVYHPTTWIDHGVLVNLAYDRFFRVASDPSLGRDENLGMPNSGAFRMTGGDTSMDEMIATTKRGLLVTRFDAIIQIDKTSQLFRGYTRDGLWLIENGKISKAVKNLVFTESILFALNNVEQLGPPQRVFNPIDDFGGFFIPNPAIVPAIKVKDFSFTALADAV